MLGLKDKARGALLCDSVRGGELCLLIGSLKCYMQVNGALTG